MTTFRLTLHEAPVKAVLIECVEPDLPPIGISFLPEEFEEHLEDLWCFLKRHDCPAIEKQLVELFPYKAKVIEAYAVDLAQHVLSTIGDTA